MERETGIEPATSSLGSWHSTAELLPLERHKNTKRALHVQITEEFSHADLIALRSWLVLVEHAKSRLGLSLSVPVQKTRNTFFANKSNV